MQRINESLQKLVNQHESTDVSIQDNYNPGEDEEMLEEDSSLASNKYLVQAYVEMEIERHWINLVLHDLLSKSMTGVPTQTDLPSSLDQTINLEALRQDLATHFGNPVSHAQKIALFEQNLSNISTEQREQIMGEVESRFIM